MYPATKRAFDVTLAAVSIVILAPPMLLIALLVYLKLGTPVLHRQRRPGLHGEPFELIKFRSMLVAFDEHDKPLPNELRVTPFGQLLRSLSLDELPELWNIFKGDMSFVGPRPLLMDYLPLYNQRQSRRHQVRPGLTGWSQINGRNSLSWEEKFEFDIWYVENASFGLDMKIILMTFVKVLRREGISHEGDVSMPRFHGSGNENQ
ncbi:MAG: sugar transferase [Rhodothermales bacterium]|nr:sugar transferase [Rhodothermales bacterium]